MAIAGEHTGRYQRSESDHVQLDLRRSAGFHDGRVDANPPSLDSLSAALSSPSNPTLAATTSTVGAAGVLSAGQVASQTISKLASPISPAAVDQALSDAIGLTDEDSGEDASNPVVGSVVLPLGLATL